MIDLLSAYLSAVIATAVLLAAVLASLFELRRRAQSYREQEARLPDACRLVTLREEVHRLEEDSKQLKAEAETAKTLLLRARMAEQWLNTNLVTYEKAIRELPTLKAEIELAEARRAECISQRQNAETECASIKAEHQRLSLLIAPLRETMERQREIKDWLAANQPIYERLLHDLPKLTAEEAALLNELQFKRQELEEAEAAYRNAQAEFAAINAEHQRLSLLVVPLRETMERQREIKDWLTANQPIYERLLHELPKLTTQVASLQKEFQAERQRLIEAEAAHSKAKAERDWVLAENRRLNDVVQGQLADSQRLNNQMGELQARQAGLLVEMEQLRIRKEAAEESCKGIELQIAQEKTALERLRQQLEDLESERATKLELVKMLDLLAKKLEADKKQLEDQIENSKRRLQAELDQINQLIQGAMQRWSQVATTIGAQDENRLKELWTPVLKKEQFQTKVADDEQTCLERTAQYLADVGLRFDRRVLNAFHTSLKVCEMSPLVVLAGISGTGKSELPRRYAEGIGMHGLTLAVQPRWDSPQDMFGFYNYLENRYRATELARALVQMDRFYDKSERGWNYPEEWKEHNLGERMLLVLLDEMNLARVEYYFSEFLSRLETRRGIDRNNAHERRKAEIMLEVGMQSLHRNNGAVNVVQQPTLPLFVDTNVLFVGTMNEDESTQTLSDKVVDRANVLRFGRPAKLESRIAGSVPQPSKSWLPYGQWKTWIRDDEKLPQSVREEVSQWGQTLNRAMQSIGRPFAHRTFASMVAYVANYPDPDAYKLAMADQIELKLLPKFRGLDPQDNAVRDALSTMQSILEQLGDEQLLEAVRGAMKNTDHQFVWQGVDRLEQV